MLKRIAVRLLIPGLLLIVFTACGGDEPAEQVLFPAVAAEEGSEEAIILDRLDQVIRALRSEDWDTYLEICNPGRDKFKLEQIVFLADTIFNPNGGMLGTNHRNVTVKVYGEDTAITESDYYEFEEHLFEDYSYSWSKVDGIWYSNSNCNTRS